MTLNQTILSDARILAAYFIFSGAYLVFALGKFPGLKIDRPGAAIIGAVLMLAFRIMGARETLQAIDFPTIVLLFSMMLIVGTLHLGGFFEWITEAVAVRLRARHLLPAVIFTSGILSAFLVNDIVCLVMTPFAIRLSRRLERNPLPYLLAVATASNIGSVATITGNPQNMLIGSVAQIRYLSFLAHLGPIALVGLFLNWALVHWIYFRPGKLDQPNQPKSGTVQRTRLPLPNGSPVIPAGKQNEASFASIAEFDHHRPRILPVVVLVLVIAAFLLGAPAAMVAATGAAVLLITSSMEPRLVYDEVDWGLLVFFIGLFIIVGGAERAGITTMLLHPFVKWNLHRVWAFSLVTGALSNIVSNVPAVMLLRPLVASFPVPRVGWLVLAMSSTLAGNLTITGSMANIIVVERARPEVHIGFREYLRLGVPLTIVTFLWGIAWLTWFQ